MTPGRQPEKVLPRLLWLALVGLLVAVTAYGDRLVAERISDETQAATTGTSRR